MVVNICLWLLLGRELEHVESDTTVWSNCVYTCLENTLEACHHREEGLFP